MKKTPSVFLRNPENMRELTREVNPAAQWVLNGAGIATRKYDGTCVMLDEDGRWWARREVKKGKTPPPNWVELEFDPETEKRMGWEPIEQSGYVKFWAEAYLALTYGWVGPERLQPGTFELCGPKIGKNPEGFENHTLIRHADAEKLEIPQYIFDGQDTAYDAFDVLLGYVAVQYGWEGLVWHHPDGRMAKLKVRDFR